MLIRVGQAGSALRWDARGRCWRWPDPKGSQLYAWPAPAGMPSGVRLLENAVVMACAASGRVLLGLGKRLGMVDLPAPGQPGRRCRPRCWSPSTRPSRAPASATAARTGMAISFLAPPTPAPTSGRSAASINIRSATACAGWRSPVVVTASSIAFSTDGRRMFFADAAGGDILQCSYDPERAKVGDVRSFAHLAEPGAGAAVVDSRDMLWSVQGGALVQYDGEGHMRQRIALAREAAASVAFGGADLKQLLLLGARGGLYGLPPDLAAGLAPGVADTLFDDRMA